jgi:hypothetical protein
MDIAIKTDEVRSMDLSGLDPWRVSDAGEFHGPAGREHYKLLAWLAQKFDKQNLFDLGTHRAASALALSYGTLNAQNPKNFVWSFDIEDKIKDSVVTQRSGICFKIVDLFNPTFRKPYHSILMNSPFIFIDIDPHEGKLEWDFYLYLKHSGYKGLCFWDDVHYFPGMQEFWKKVNEDKDSYKLDLTPIGHWSGSVLSWFNPDIKVILV